MKGQAAIEYMFILGFLVLAMTPILYYSLQGQGAYITINQAEDAAAAIANTVNSVYALGSGSRDIVWVTLPKQVVNVSLDNNEVLVQIKVGEGLSDIISQTKVAMNGSVLAEPGTYKLAVVAFDNIVQVSQS